MISDDKYIEMLVAGINRFAIPNAEVEWDATRNKRQFDVLATIEVGPYKLLIAIEVKHKSRAVSVETVDAFVTKAKDVGAQKAVIVSTSGFQSGCLDVAKKHALDLFKLTFNQELDPIPPTGPLFMQLSGGNDLSYIPPPKIEFGEKVVGPQVDRISLHYLNGKRFNVPGESSQMQYYLHQTSTSLGKTLLELLSQHPIKPAEVDVRNSYSIKKRMEISPPDEFFFPRGAISSIEFEAVGVSAPILEGNVNFEQSAFSTSVKYENVVTREVFDVPVNQLPIGPPKLELGEFYFTYHPLRYFYCDSFKGQSMKIYMVESFQIGELVQTIYTQNPKWSRYYIPLADKKISNRLNTRLRQMKSRQV